jgi:hypothetical protein
MDWERPSERFLSYLDRLVQAAVDRDRDQVEKLLRMRIASHLPRAVLDEMEYLRRAREANLRAPLRLMRYHHQMHQLATAPTGKTQLALELRERELSAPDGAPRRRAPRATREEGGGRREED